jgi:hypothetical protein
MSGNTNEFGLGLMVFLWWGGGGGGGGGVIIRLLCGLLFWCLWVPSLSSANM